MNNEKGVKGYKAFERNWTCQGFQYEVGKTFEMDREDIEMCKRGFHFCLNIHDCFNFYPFDKDRVRIAEVIAYDKILKNEIDKKYCTNKIEIIREVPWDEVLGAVNLGINNIGMGNLGYYNQGNYNIGDWNIGHRNVRGYNIGSYNTGSFNIGDCNSGSFNKGNKNTGDHNIGHNCTGCWNKCDFANGFFNTEEPELKIFNIPIKLTDKIETQLLQVIMLLDTMPTEISRPDNIFNRNNELTQKSSQELESLRQNWWKTLTDEEKQIIFNIPNFDKYIFYQITGIRTD